MYLFNFVYISNSFIVIIILYPFYVKHFELPLY